MVRDQEDGPGRAQHLFVIGPEAEQHPKDHAREPSQHSLLSACAFKTSMSPRVFRPNRVAVKLRQRITPQVLVGKWLGFGSFRRGTIRTGSNPDWANREIFIFWHR